MLLDQLEKKGLIQPPTWLNTNTIYLVVMGSYAYGVSDDQSDLDIYGICVPPKDNVFPHLRGEIPGFGRQIQRFEQWQQHHIFDSDARGGKGQEYDFSVYSIVAYFRLCMENNPNMVDSLFAPVDCIRHMNAVGRMIRDNRRLFLHRGCWHKLKGYAFSQMAKIQNRTAENSPERQALIEKYGFDTKFAYHVVRLLDEAEQILTTGDLDLRRNAEQLKAIRRGEWSLERIQAHFQAKERELEEVYNRSELPWGPDEAEIKSLLLRCLEAHYGTLQGVLPVHELATAALLEIEAIITRVRREQEAASAVA
jgi:predicted nucleotidyltransferase